MLLHSTLMPSKTAWPLANQPQPSQPGPGTGATFAEFQANSTLSLANPPPKLGRYLNGTRVRSISPVVLLAEDSLQLPDTKEAAPRRRLWPGANTALQRRGYQLTPDFVLLVGGRPVFTPT